MDQEIQAIFSVLAKSISFPILFYEKSLYFGCNLLSEFLFLLELAI